MVLEWRTEAGNLSVEAPPGEHVSPDAPMDGWIALGGRRTALAAIGTAGPFGVPDPRGSHVKGELSLSLCDDAGTSCRRVTLAFSGEVPDQKRGRVALVVGEPEPEVVESVYGKDATGDVERAFAQASASGKAVLLDFTAVWCPPCQRLAAEVLDSQAPPAILDQYVVVRVDADERANWAIKDRYAVGGYPTVVAASADGAEIGRLVGYESAAATADWLAETISGEKAEDPTDPESPAFRIARLEEAATMDDLRWLAAHPEVDALRWVPSALDLQDQPGAKDLMRGALSGWRGSFEQDSDRLAYLGELADDPSEKAALFGAAATVLRSGLSGDPVRDRGFMAPLADLFAEAGEPDEAIRVLEALGRAFPDDPTPGLNGSRILLAADRPADALALADRTFVLAWGDNRLRMGATKAKALVALGRKDEAKAFASALLAEIPEPPDGVEVRTSRYRKALAEAVE